MYKEVNLLNKKFVLLIALCILLGITCVVLLVNNKGEDNSDNPADVKEYVISPTQSITQDTNEAILSENQNDNQTEVTIENIEIPLGTTDLMKLKGLDGVYIFNEYGGKPNDINYDNSIPLQKLLDITVEKGGIIFFGYGEYEFKTPIKINEKLSGVKIMGVSVGLGDNHGTLLNWTGEGFLFNITKELWWCNFESVRIVCHDNSAFNIEGLMYKSYIKDITIISAIKGVYIGSYAYAFLDNVTFHTENKATEYGIKIGCNSKATCEFIYIQNCSIGGGGISNGNGIEINSGASIYIKQCDICDWINGNAIFVQRKAKSPMLSLLYISDINVIRCDSGISFYAQDHIESVFLNNVAIIFRGNSKEEKGLHFNNEPEKVIQITVENFHTRKIGSIAPEYIIFAPQACIQASSSFHVALNLAKGKVKIGNEFSKAIIDYAELDYERRFTFKGDGIETAFTCLITNFSPYTNPPVISVNTNQKVAYSIEIFNTNGGDLGVIVTFKEAPRDNISIYTNVSKSGYN